jgi:hypothetical protein
MTAPSVTRTDEDFLALVYADPDLVQAEFEAILAAEWFNDMAAPGSRDGWKLHRPRRSKFKALSADVKPERVASGKWARDRSPPPR